MAIFSLFPPRKYSSTEPHLFPENAPKTGHLKLKAKVQKLPWSFLTSFVSSLILTVKKDRFLKSQMTDTMKSQMTDTTGKILLKEPTLIPRSSYPSNTSESHLGLALFLHALEYIKTHFPKDQDVAISVKDVKVVKNAWRWQTFTLTQRTHLAKDNLIPRAQRETAGSLQGSVTLNSEQR